MTKWLIKHFVTGRCGDDKKEKRLYCGRLSGIVGITLNFALGFVKIFVGTATSSVAITADAVNNLSDAGASVVTLVGFSLANRKSDAEHPFGHARYEYMTGAIVSALVIVVGVMLIRGAWEEVINPTPIITDNIVIVLLIILTLAKLWLFRFNIKLSKLIDSASLKATGIDSRNDAIISTSTLIVILLFKYAGINIDALVAVAVGCFIIYSGLKMIRETVDPLLGQTPDSDTIREIANFVLDHEGVLGIHDLIVHDYGPGNVFASVHIEVDSREDIFRSHELVDDIETEAYKKLRIFLVGHMDPLDTQNPVIQEIEAALEKKFEKMDDVLEFHDLRIVVGPNHTKVIFDVVAAHNDPESTFAKVEKAAQETLKAMDQKYLVVVNRDLDFSSSTRKEERQAEKTDA